MKWLKNKEFSKYFFNTSWMMFERILRMVSGLFVGAWVARYLGAENFGSLSYAQSFVFLFSAFATLGLDSVVVRELVKDKTPSKIIIGSAFTLRLVSSITIVAIIFSFVSFRDLDENLRMMIVVISISMILQSFNVIDLHFQSIVKSKFVSISNVATLILSIVFKAYFILTDKPLIYFAWAFVIEAVFLALFLIYFYAINNNRIFQWRFNLKLSISILKESWPLILSGASVAIAMRIDQMMLMSYLGKEELGIYSVGVKLAEAMSFIPAAILASVYPKIIEKELISNVTFHRKLFGLPLLGLFSFSLIIALLSWVIVYILFGAEYERSSTVLAILTWSVPLSYIGGYINKLLVSKGLSKLVLYRQLSLLILNVLLNIILIPKFGIIGAALATMTADLIINSSFHYIFKQTRHFKILFGFNK